MVPWRPRRVRWPDWVLLLASAALMLAGPAMALEEWQAHEQALAAEALTGESPPLDPALRAPWRLPLLGLVFLVGAFGAWSCLRALAQPVTRAVSRRLVALLVVGMTILDAAFLLDGAVFADAPYALRAATIVWAYPLGAFLVAGSAHRLAEVARTFGERAR